MHYLGWARVGVLVGLVSLTACARLGVDVSGLHGGDGGLSPDVLSTDGQMIAPPPDQTAGDSAPGFFPTTTVTGGQNDTAWFGATLGSTKVAEGVVRLGVQAGFVVKSERLPGARAWASAAASGSQIVVIGGGTDPNDSAQTPEVLSYNPLTDTITNLADLPDGISQAAAVGLPNGAVYSIKGKNTGFSLEGNLYRIDATQGSVVKTAATMEKSFRHTAALGLDGLIYVLGGVGSGPIVNKIETFDPVNDKMLPVAVGMDVVGGREHARAATAANGIIYVFGGALDRAADGAAPTASTNLTDQILALDPTVPSIAAVASLPQPLMNVALGHLPDGRIVIVGGDTLPTTKSVITSVPTAQVFAFDPKQPSAGAQLTADVLPYALSGAAAAMGANGKLYLFGGVKETGLSDAILELHPYTKDGAVVGPVTDLGAPGQRWTELAWKSEVPPGTSLQVSVRAADTSFSAADLTPEWKSVGNQSPVQVLPSGRFVQWRISLGTTNTASTPTLLEVTCAYLKAAPSAPAP